MRLDGDLMVELVLSNDETRPHLNSAWLDVEAGRLVATNGHALAIVPVELEPGDKAGPVPPGAVRAARKRETECQEGAVVCGDVTYKRGDAEHPASTAEKRAQIVPSFRPGDAGTVTFGLNAALLLKLARSIGAHASEGYTFVGLTVKIPEPGKPMLSCILVTPGTNLDDSGAVGALMPARVGK